MQDFLRGRLFHGCYPDGSPIEAYILTSALGAKRIRERAGLLGLADRIEDMLIVVPAPTSADSSTGTCSDDDLSSDVDISLIPKLLYDKYDMRLINHDGGRQVLAAFGRSGSLCQMNLTLGRGFSVKELLSATTDVSEIDKRLALESFDERIKNFKFFRQKSIKAPASTTEGRDKGDDVEGQYVSGIPRNFQVASIITNDAEDVAVVTFRIPSPCDYYILN